ncbi:MAG: histidine phosphatase family protein [Sulfurovaceae bacterium]|nr:histidine phosphatase family protein [Sulfurovaceae bacterium]
MKTIYFIRHAKSDWSKENIADLDRGLTKRGSKDLKSMSSYLLKKKIKPDLILSSPALRAKKTAKKISKKIKYNKDIKYMDELYMPDPKTILDILSDQKNKNKNIFLVNHNPALTDLANMLADEKIDNIPTLGIVAIKFDIKKWEDIKDHKGNIDFFVYPKLLKKS